ncbi:hypothetical protein [Lunatimonas sp.]|nr:hypothetical protein [Lunatimonas sp.]
MDENSKVSGIVHLFIIGKVIIFLGMGRNAPQMPGGNFLNGNVRV